MEQRFPRNKNLNPKNLKDFSKTVSSLNVLLPGPPPIHAPLECGILIPVDPSVSLSLAFEDEDKEAPLRVNPEPSGRDQAEGQASCFRPGSQGVEGLTFTFKSYRVSSESKPQSGLKMSFPLF